jgi:hypothetical protein
MAGLDLHRGGHGGSPERMGGGRGKGGGRARLLGTQGWGGRGGHGEQLLCSVHRGCSLVCWRAVREEELEEREEEKRKREKKKRKEKMENCLICKY